MQDSRFKIQDSDCRGQSLFEVVIALAVSTAVIVGLVILATVSIRNAAFSKNKTLAARYSQETAEWLRGERDSGFDDFEGHALASANWCMPELNWNKIGVCGDGDKISGTPFTRQVTFTVTIQDGKVTVEADVSVSWEDSQGSHIVKSVTGFTDWRQR